ncbi:MAG: hypothetical protein J6R30_01430 [Bacteroidales bacterium]|nr:hypothetical protein [Bacteroidales bacterium]
MKKIIFLLVAAFMAVTALAQNVSPTVNWPYMYPDFLEGEIEKIGGLVEKGRYNIHLNIGTLHYLKDGTIEEHPTVGIKSMTIGDDVYRNVGGKMLKVLAQTEGGFVVLETLANFTGIISRDGAYGGAVANRDKTFSHQENNGSFNGYLITDSYKDLIAIKDDSDKVPVTQKTFIVIGIQMIFANKSTVIDMTGVDKKAFSAFLKANDIKWKEPEDLVKIIDFITASE